MEPATLAFLSIDTLQDAEEALQEIGADPRGVAIMREKAIFRVIKLYHVPLRAANLLKQTFLSQGAEAAVSRETADMTAEVTDMLLMATLAQYRRCIARMRQQPFGLATFADELQIFLWNTRP